MKKIPTVFVRDFENSGGRYVTDQVTPGCEWVLAGEGVATRKYDGTCVMFDDDGAAWARREVKAGKQPPPGFVAIESDETTGKTVGWEPAAQSSFAKFIGEAVALGVSAPGTYELVGPKVNGNPERRERHELIRHADAGRIGVVYPMTFAEVRRVVTELRALDNSEGIVWHHPDGRMAKIKARDFPE